MLLTSPMTIEEELREIDARAERAEVLDRVLSKAVSVSPVAQIARIETGLRDYLRAKWKALANEAIKVAGKMVDKGSTPSAIANSIEAIMGRWDKEVEGRYKRDLEKVYFLSRQAMWDKFKKKSNAKMTYDIAPVTKAKSKKTPLPLKPRFNLADDKAVKELTRGQTFWLGRHVDQISDSIHDAARRAIEGGLDHQEQGRMMREYAREALDSVKTPDGWAGSSDQYFEGLVANATTTARASGQVRSLEDLRVTKYEINNPEDEKTCEVCNFMSGKVFEVSQGSEQIDAVLGLGNPEKIKSESPWLKFSEVESIYNGGGTDALAEAGFCLPPFHFKCRCAVDISEEAGSFDIGE